MWCGKGNVNVCFGRLFWQACNGNVCSHKTASPKPFCLSTVSSNWTRIRVLWSSVCTPHCNPHWLVDKQQYKSGFDIVVLVTKRPLSCGTISYELPGAAAAIRRGTRAVPASLVCMVILPHSSGSKWCCDSTKSAAAMSSFLQVPLYFPQSRNNLYHVHLLHLSLLHRWELACLVMLHMEPLPDVPVHLCYGFVCIQEDWVQWG